MGKSIEIQKLRAFAVLMVLLAHMPFKLPDYLIHGYTGVSLFFVISGYVVTLSFIRHLPDIKGFFNIELSTYMRDFYVRRFFRIIPVAMLWILIYFIIAQCINYKGGQYGDMFRWVKELKWLLTGCYNYFFAMSHMPGLFGHYWSLAVEMQFYFVLPLLLVVFRSKKQRVYLCISLIIIISTLLRIVTPIDLIRYLTHTQADSLLLGVLICILCNQGNDISQIKVFKYNIPQYAKNLIFGILLLALWLLPFRFDYFLNPIYKYPIFTAISGIIVYLAQRNEGWILGSNYILDKVLDWIGERSYSIYVSHIILYSGIYYYLYYNRGEFIPSWIKTTSTGVFSQTLFLIAFALLVGELSYKFIELPYMQYGKNVISSLHKEKKYKTQYKKQTTNHTKSIQRDQ